MSLSPAKSRTGEGDPKQEDDTIAEDAILNRLDQQENCSENEDAENKPDEKKRCPWKWRFHPKVSKEQIRWQLHRSKKRMEEHVCYPWLRRLFFHLSHYFPNLHGNQRSRSRYSARSGYAAPRGDRSSSLNNEDMIRSTLRTSMFPFDESGHIGSDVMRPTSPQLATRGGSKRGTVRRHRRPLQRQKSSGMPDFEYLFAQAEQISDLSVDTSSPMCSQRPKSGGRQELDSGARCSKTTPGSKRQKGQNNPTCDICDVDNDELLDYWDDYSIPNVNDLSQTRRSKNKSIRHNSPRTQKSRHSRYLGKESKLSSLEGYRDSINECSFEDDPRAQDEDMMPVFNDYSNTSSRSIPNNQRSQRSGTGGQRNSSDKRSYIQFRRVQARRHSSTSQVESFGQFASARIPPKSGADDIGQMRTTEPPRTPVSVSANAPLMEERVPMNKNFESWLEEAVNITRLKQNRRRGNICRMSSGDTAYEFTNEVNPQLPHSFDVPVANGSFDHYPMYRQPYSLNNQQFSTGAKPMFSESMRSSESPHFIVPSLTVDSNDDGLPASASMEQEDPSLNSAQMFLNPISHGERFCAQRRYSDYPCTESRQHQSESYEPVTYHANVGKQLSCSMRFKPVHTSQSPPCAGSLLMTPAFRERAGSYQGPASRNYVAAEPNPDDISEQMQTLCLYGDQSNSCDQFDFSKQSRSFSSPRRKRLFRAVREDSDPSRRAPNDQQIVGQPRHLFYRSPPKPVPGQFRSRLLSSHKSWQESSLSTGDQRSPPKGTISETPMSGQLSMDSDKFNPSVFLRQPNLPAYLGRRYSHHLKPLDAWTNRQSQSMEVVTIGQTTPETIIGNSAQCMPAAKPQPRKMPVVYSRSMQQSTSSFPPQWSDFLSGPELSLTSPFNSSNVTPDSQKTKFQYDQPFERRIFRPKLSAEFHTHSASGSPGSPHMRNPMLKAFAAGNRERPRLTPPHSLHPCDIQNERKVRSFEFNVSTDRPSDRCSNQTYLMLPNHFSSESSRRGSALSGASFHSAIEPPTTHVHGPELITNIPSLPLNQQTRNTKLIPPDLTFSPASRRTSIMEDGEQIMGDMILQDLLLNSSEPPEPELLPKIEKDQTCLRIDTTKTATKQRSLEYWKEPKTVSSTLGQFYSPQRRPSREYESGLIVTPSHACLHGSFQKVFDPNNGLNVPHPHSRLPYNSHSVEFTSNHGNRGISSPPHSHEDLRRSRSQFASSNFSTYPPNTKQLNNSSPNQARSGQPLNEPGVGESNRSSRKHRSSDRRRSPVVPGERCRARSAVGAFKKDEWSKTKANKNNSRPKTANPELTTKRVSRNLGAMSTRNKSAETSKLGVPYEGENCEGRNYLFRSSSTHESTVDPKLLQPSLRPVVDSSDESVTDEEETNTVRREDDRVGRNKSAEREIMTSPSFIQTPSRPLTDHHAARRRSFLALYWQQAVERSGNTSLDSFDTLRTDTDP
ncbi:unnamed protein product [Calicophoron daubneyi]|uniref:Uncharacterized protein n=1 Tax=Calicophoron daubneyi TaxID=300641 RepID=A0AAV2TR81_CALDB